MKRDKTSAVDPNSAVNLTAKDHPDRRPHEVYIGNYDESGFARLHYATKRRLAGDAIHPDGGTLIERIGPGLQRFFSVVIEIKELEAEEEQKAAEGRREKSRHHPPASSPTYLRHIPGGGRIHVHAS